MTRKLVLGLALALLLVPVAAAAVWLPTMKLSPAPSSEPQVALSPRGDAFVVWWSEDAHDGVIRARVRPARARAWGGARRLSPAGRRAASPRIAVNASGNAVAAWYLPGPPPPPDAFGADQKEAVQAAFRPAGRTWQRAQTLARGVEPDVALDPRGNALIVWRTLGGVVQGSFRRARGRWEPARTLSPLGRQAFGPRVAFDRRGNAIAVWYRRPDTGPDNLVQAALRPAGRSWQAAQTLGTGVDFYSDVEVAFDAAGTALVVWIGPVNGSGRVEAVEHRAGGAWSAPELLSTPGLGASDAVSVGIGASGETVVAWSQFMPPFVRVQAAVRRGGGSWGAPQDLSGPGYFAHQPQVAVDPAGNALVVWYHTEDRGFSSIEATMRPAGGAWSGPVELAQDGQEHDVAVDAAGNAVAVWQQPTVGSRALEARAFDAAGPIFARVRIARRGSVGRPLAFSVSAFDVWSKLRGAPVWSFGDGGSARGAAVTHTYRRPGSFRVILRASDSRGNKSSLTRAIMVTRHRR